METEVTFKYNETERKFTVQGYPQLENLSGVDGGEGMAFFFGNKNYDFHIANTITGKIRQLGTPKGCVLVDDDDIDYEAVKRECKNGSANAFNKVQRYGGLNRYDGFKNGLCAICWTLYPDGRYFGDDDGFGMQDNNEETIYAIINTNLELVEPFRPIKDILTYLEELRNKK